MTLTPRLDGSHRIPYDCDLTRDPGAPMTAPAPVPDLTEFRLWLETTRGLGRRTTFTAVSQVRRVLRDCGPQVSEASLRAWHDERPSHLRTPVVSNWRRYREWWATKGIPGIPDFPKRPGAAPQRAPIPDTVCVALGALQTAGVGPTAIQGIVWRPLEAGSPLHAALLASTPGLATGEITALHTSTGIATVATTALVPLLAWGHDGTPKLDAPLVPTEPGGDAPMPVTRLRRLARRGRQILAGKITPRE